MDLICVGDVMLDVRVDAGELARGGDVHGRVALHPGGTSANAAVWAAQTGATARVHGKVGVDVEAGERSMVADRGANARLSPGDLPPTLEAGAVLVSGYLLLQSGAQEAGVETIARSRAPWIGVEAASWPLVEAVGAGFDELTSGATIVFANDRESEALTGLGPEDAVRALGERYRAACVKLGARGAALVVDGDLYEHTPDPVEEADPTGAGDAFDGVLLGALARGFEPAEALRSACAAGAEVAASASVWPAVAR
jgi:sugar/nucleoside kinase (ribokinase family)